MSRLIAFAMATPSPKSDRHAVTSKNASSTDRPSTSGVYRLKISKISALTSL
jgi:hypothetical protein